MLSRQMREEQVSLWAAMRSVLCRRGVRPGLFRPYWNFLLQAEKVKRQRFVGLNRQGRQERHDFGAVILVQYEAKEHAWRALVEKYVKDGLDREVLLSLLWNVLTVRLD